LAVASLFGLTLKGVSDAKDLTIEKVNIKIKDLKKSYSIVQLSDIHIGGLIDKEFIKNLVSKVNSLKPDLVVITGDMIDIDIKSAKPILVELNALNSKYGTYFVVGNHEYFHNIKDILDAVKSLNIKVLENDSVYIGDKSSGFNLLGVYDVIGYRKNYCKPDIDKACSNIDKNSPNILLAHQPRYIEKISSDIRVDLMLSGHTHGGQIYPFRFLVKLKQPYIEGLYKDNLGRQIYVNRGTGFWGPPMRLGAKPEISYITLKS
jgi:predicted MPP superfamily phosphohydrolase